MNIVCETPTIAEFMLISVEKKFIYEVAFSFLQEDEALAYQINDLIHDRLTTFIYSAHQKEAVGKDGIETYTKVFLEDSRIVVILFREKWGTTPFTRIEENAIKQRNSEEGLDFTIFISLDKKKPKWVSKLQIWYDFDRYGIKPTAAIIEKRVAEYGGQIRDESVLDKAARYKREILREIKLKEYLNTPQALSDCRKEVMSLLLKAKENIEAITDNQLGIRFGSDESICGHYIIWSEGLLLAFKWIQPFQNSLYNSHLKAFIAKDDFFYSSPQNNKKTIRGQDYVFHINEAETKGWINQQDKSEFFISEHLINFWQKEFLELAREERIKRQSKG